MKKITSSLLALASFIAFSAKAQITITQADMPQVGDQFIEATDASNSTMPGSAGAGVTWNFSSLATSSIDSLKGYTPSATPYGSMFPSSNVCFRVYTPTSGANDSWEYFNSTSGSFTLQDIAFYNSSTSAYVFYKLNPTWPFVTLPATYKAHWGGVYRSIMKEPYTSYPGYDSLGIIEHGTYYDTIDAYGTLTTPLGTFNTLRNKHIEKDVDSTIVHATGGSWSTLAASKSSNNYFAWYANGMHYSLCNITMDSTGKTVTQIQWLKTDPAGIQTISNTSKTIVYPVPATNYVDMQMGSAEAYQVIILDMTGKQMEKAELHNNRIRINTTYYASGLYLYEVVDRNGNAIDHGKFSVLK